MSGKQDKKSRRLKASLNGHVKKRVHSERVAMSLDILQAYQNELRKQNIFKRFRFCWRLMWRSK